MLRPKDTLYYMTGMPYDTIQQVIGVVGDNPKTLKEYDINFDYTPLNEQVQPYLNQEHKVAQLPEPLSLYVQR